jgi:hypothetical protein
MGRVFGPGQVQAAMATVQREVEPRSTPHGRSLAASCPRRQLRRRRNLLLPSVLVVSVLLVGAIAASAPGASSMQRLAERKGAWVTPRTPWGDPDLQGIWPTTNMIGVPLTRAPEFGQRNTLTDAEFAERQQRAAEQAALDNSNFDPDNPLPPTGPELTTRGGGQLTVTPPVGPDPHWLEPGRPSRQASLVVDPTSGQLPPMTANGERRAAALAARRARPTAMRDRSLYTRCISRGVVGSVLPMVTDSGNQIVQAPGHVVIRHEMIHDTRIIPLDRRPHVSAAIRQYLGDSRGHWEGDTLVVETRNLTDDLGIGMNGGGTPMSPVAVLTERLTRTGEDTLFYELTINDPETWLRPWTIAFSWNRNPRHELFEFSCHEGNYSMWNMLTAELSEAAER